MRAYFVALVGAMLISGVLILPNVFGNRDVAPLFPVAAVFCRLAFATPFLQAVSVLSIAMMAISRCQNKLWFYTLTLAVTLLICMDVNRLQPWVVQYVLMLFSLHQSSFWFSWRCILGGIYFWSGVHKLNESFASKIFPRLVRVEWLPASVGYVAAFSETVFGWLILFRIRLGLVGAFAMHVFILCFCFSYTVIIPWNLCCMIALMCIYKLEVPVHRRTSTAEAVVFVISWILPGLFFVDWYPAYLSFSMFGGDVKMAAVLSKSSKAIGRLSWSFLFQSVNSFDPFLLDLSGFDSNVYRWRMHPFLFGEYFLSSPLVPERLVYLSLFKHACQQIASPKDLLLTIQQPAHLFLSSWIETYYCSDAAVVAAVACNA